MQTASTQISRSTARSRRWDKSGINGDATELSGSIWSGNGACSFNYGKRLAIYIHLQQTLICCTACLQVPSILGYSIDISACSTIVSYISHPAEPLEIILIGLWWW